MRRYSNLFIITMALISVLVTAVFPPLTVSAGPLLAPTIAVTKTDTIIGDDGDGKADPGETIEYSVTIANSGTDATGVTFTDVIDANTTLVGGSLNVSPLAIADTYETIGNTLLEVGVAAGVDPAVHVTGNLFSNDMEFLGDSGTFNILSHTNPSNGTLPVFNNSTGTFTYLPNANFVGTDTFTYTLQDSGGLTDTALVTITVTGRVWYVKNNAAAGGLGRSTDPFDTLVEAQTASSANDTIYVFFGDGTTTGQNAGIVLKTGQRLLGEGVDLTVPVSVNGGPNPTVLRTAGSLPLIDNTAGIAVSVPDVANVEIRGLNIAGNTNAIDVTTTGAVTGTYEIANNIIRSSSQEGIDFNSNAGSSGTLTLSLHDNTVTSTGNGIDIQRAAGNVTITAFDDNNVSGNTAGTGINVVGTGATILFDAVNGGNFDTVSGGTTVIGQSGNGVGQSGLVLSNIRGDLSFTDLDVYADAGTALLVNGTSSNYTGSSGTRVVANSNTPALVAVGGAAASLTDVAVTLVLTTMSSTNSATTGVSLNKVSGTFTAPSGSAISNATGTDFFIDGNSVAVNNVNVTYPGTITDKSGRLVQIQNVTGLSTHLFSGAITDNGGTSTGISLTGNSGATMTFSGGLSLVTGSNPAFTATGGGTVNVCDEAACDPVATGALVNTLTTTTGTALTVTNTNIGSSYLEFRSISANGAAKGITLNATGSGGGLKVVGTGSTDGSGGTIQNNSTRGGEFISTSNLSLRNMNFTSANNATDSGGSGTCDDLTTTSCNAAIYLSSVSTVTLDNLNITGTMVEEGINGNTVSNFTLSNSTVSNCGNEVEEGCIKMRQLTGTSSISNSDIAFPGADAVEIVNTSGSLLLNIDSSTFRDSQSSASGGTGIQLRNQSTASGTINVINSSFLRIRTVGLNVQAINSGTSDVDVTSSTFDPSTGDMIGIDLSADNTATLKFNVLNNTKVYSRNGPAINIFGDTSAVINGRINSNTDVQVLGGVGSGIRANINKNATANIEVKNNTVNVASSDSGIDLSGIGKTAASGSNTLDATVTGNSVTIGSVAAYGIVVVSASNAGDYNSVCANIASNGITRNASSITSFRARVPSANGALRLQGFNTNPELTWNTNSNTPVSAGGSEVSYGGSGTFGSCTATAPTNGGLTPITMLPNPGVAANAPVDQVSYISSGETSAKLLKSQSRTSFQSDNLTQTNVGSNKSILSVQPAPRQSGEMVSFSIGTLPAGESVTIKFQVTVDNPLPLGTTRIANQATISGSNFSNVLTTNGGPVDCEVGTETCTPVDRPDTTVTSINRSTSSPANAASVSWTVTFANAVSGLTSSNFSLVSGGLGGTPAITAVTAVGGSPATQWTVTASTGTGNGTLGLDMTNDTGLSHDTSVLPFTGQAYTIDRTAPTVSSIVRQSPASNPTNADVLVFRVTFNEPVMSVGSTSFVASGTTTPVSTIVTAVTPNLVFDFTISGIADGGNLSTLNGTVGLDVAASPTITDLAGNTLQVVEPTPAASNDQTYTVDNSAPVATNFNRFNPATTPTNADTLVFQAIFSEDVTGVDDADFTIPGLTGSTISVSPVSASSYNVTVSGGNLTNFNGLIDLDFNSPTIYDLVGNALSNTVVGFDQHYMMDNTAPTVSMTSVTTDPTNVSPILVTVQFSETVTGFTGADITPVVNGTVSNFTAVDGDTYTFDLTPTTSGPVTADIAASVAQDAAGNPNSAAAQFSRIYDNTAPTVSMTSAATDPTGTTPIAVNVTFSESVTGFTAADIVPGNATISNFAGSGANYSFDLNPLGDGTVTADIAANVATDTAGNYNVIASQFSRLFDTADPTVTIDQAASQVDPTSTNPINFTVTFSEDVTDFDDLDDVNLSGTATATVTSISGGPRIYTVDVTATSAGTVTADVPAGKAQDLAGRNNTVSAPIDDTVTYVPPTDLSITKTDGVTSAVPGQSVTYTITVSNAGPNDDPSATVADTFPASLTATWTCVGAVGGICTTSGSGNINDTVNLPAGGSVTYTVTASISASATGSLVNTATVSSSIADTDASNDSATDTDTLDPQADLAITNTDGITTAIPGGSVTYTLTASNAGPSNAPGSTVADTFPAILTATWTCVGAGGGTCTASGSGNINDTVNLPAGGSVTYTVSATISAAATGTLSNTATVSASVTDPDLTNNSATDTDTLTPQADVAITKTDGVTVVIPGGSTTYTITASNAGPSNAPSTLIADTFPASLTATWTCVGAGGGTCTSSGSGNISDVVNLPAGGSVTYTASTTVSSSATGTVSNTANVTSAVFDPTLANNSAMDTDSIVPPVTVTINQKTAASAQADPTNVGPINFTVVFASAVTDFDDASDITLGGTAGATTVTITGSGATYNVAVSGMTGDGTVTATIPAAVANGTLGQPNAASTSSDNSVFYDATVPDTTIDPPTPSNPNNSTSVTFNFSSSDGSGAGVTSMECRLDGGTFTACDTATIQSYSGLSNGSHIFEVRAIDAAGNVDLTPASYTWTIDTAGPTVIVSSSVSSPTNTSPISVTITFSENVTGFTPSVAAGDIVITNGTDSNPAGSGTTYTFDLTPTGQGPVTVQVPAGSAVDGASNPNTISNLFSVTYDSTAPTVQIEQAAGQIDPTNTSPVNFTVVFNEPVANFANTDVTLTGTSNPSSAVVTQIAPNDGTSYNVAVSGMSGDGTVIASINANVATDAAGNNNAASVSTDNTVTYNTAAPETTIDSNPPALSSGTTAAFTFSSTAVDLAGFECQLDGGGFSACTSPQNLTGLSAGPHTFEVRAVDNAANTDPTPASFTWTVDTGFPTVLFNSNTVPSNNASVTTGPTQITVAFSEDVKNDGSAGAANSIANYLLVEDGINNAFNTTTCSAGLVADDAPITVDLVSYTNNSGSGPFIATLDINGGTPLPLGTYRLFICGTTSIEDLAGNELNNGTSDALLTFDVVAPQTALPQTGFPQGSTTVLPQQPANLAYASTDLWLEIPKLGVRMSIVGVPKVQNSWDVTWLDQKAGWLNGSSYPTWNGNSVITAHVWDALNRPGPFAKLKDLNYGDQIKIHAFGKIYTYEIRTTRSILPTSISTVFKHEEKSWITLLTCEDYQEKSETYSYRRIVRAVLVSVENEK